MSAEVVLVRMSRALLDILAEEDSEPVVIVGIDKQDDGTYDMVLRSVEKDLTRHERCRAALRSIRGPADQFDWFMDAYVAAGGGYEGLQAIAREALGDA